MSADTQITRAGTRRRSRLGRLDRRLLNAAARQRSPAGNRVMTTASTLANRSLLWAGVAGVLALTGRRRARAAAASGLLGIGIAATLANGPLKFIWRRERPTGDAFGPLAPLLPLPRTFSFPSGHSASAFAFATGVTRTFPLAGPAVLPAAATVAYSRVHTGVHYPSDVLIGSAVGVASGLAAAAVIRHRQASAHGIDAPSLDVALPRSAVLLTSSDAGSADALDAAREALESGGIRIVDEVAVQHADRLDTIVRDAESAILLVAAGGDGTVSAAAGAAVNGKALFAVLPLGTSNDVARSLGMPMDPVDAARAITQGRVCAVDAAQVARADEPPAVFLHAATLGLNAAFADLATTGSMRERFGAVTYPVAAAAAVRRYQPFRCTVEHDGATQSFQAVHLSIGNAPVFGGVLGMRAPGASMTDGLLDVLIVERLSMTRLLIAVADSIVGEHRPVHRVHTMRVRSLAITVDGDQRIAVDGEVGGGPPAEFRALPGALRVVVPAVG